MTLRRFFSHFKSNYLHIEVGAEFVGDEFRQGIEAIRDSVGAQESQALLLLRGGQARVRVQAAEVRVYLEHGWREGLGFPGQRVPRAHELDGAGRAVAGRVYHSRPAEVRRAIPEERFGQAPRQPA